MVNHFFYIYIWARIRACRIDCFRTSGSQPFSTFIPSKFSRLWIDRRRFTQFNITPGPSRTCLEALSQWRSSWLSREGVLAILVLASLGCWFAFTFFIGPPPLWSGILILLLIVATVYATSMIYGSLKTVACWHHPLTPVCYLMFSACGGSVAFLTMLALFGQASPGILTEITLAFLIGAWILKYAWWWALDNRGSASNLETATGLGMIGKVRSLMPPHTSENYLQKEMGFVVARRHAIKLRFISIFFGALLPIICVILGGSSAGLLSMATIFHVIGIFVERWLFFAEAKHVVTLYYGDEQLSIAS